MRDILLVAELTIREARRRRILWTALGLGLAFVALYGVGFYFIHRDMVRYRPGAAVVLDSSFGFVVMAAMYVISFLGVMLAVLTSVGTLSGEISSHTIQTLATKPLRRSALVIGKWLGLFLMLVCYVFLLGGGVSLVTWAISGYLLPNVVQGIALVALQAVIMLSVSLLGSTRLSTVTNGVAAFMLYGLAFVGGWVEQVGSFMHNETAVDIGILSSLLIPSEAMWKLASYVMQPPAIRTLGLSPFSMAASPSTAMLAYALGYVVVMVALAVRSFGRRDL
ncbi:MAG: ABC transporter permease [Chloroflexi bacterium]|nr:ABC transporter permease [Chloroflexota bacterium]